MSITDELREWAKTLTRWWYDPVKDEYTYTTYIMPPSIDAIRLDSSIIAIADRIDAEHQKALDEWKAKHGQMWLKGYAECHAELLEGNETLAADLENCGWVRLPVDADNVPVRIGDVMEWVDGDTFEVVGIGDGVLYYVEDGGALANWTLAESKIHHAPTVEDVLTEMFAKAIERGELTNGAAQTIAEYAKRLTLAAKEDA